MTEVRPVVRTLAGFAFVAATVAGMAPAFGAQQGTGAAREKGATGTARKAASRAGPRPAVGPGQGSGKRRVAAGKPAPDGASTPRASSPAPVESNRESTASGAAGKTSSKPEPKPNAHQKGRPPREPKPTLPAGTLRAEPDAQVRRQIAQGATAEQLRRGVDDPELRALHEADRVLFPRALQGATPGWSWDVPRPVETGRAESVATGVPPSVRLEASADRPETKPAQSEWMRSLTMPNLPVRLDARVAKYLRFYRDSAKGRSIAKVWAKKSGQFAAALRAELAKAGLPTDLIWLALIESGYNPTIRSPAGAAGLWQFMPDTARSYGLTVDRWVDERLDPRRATEAAVRLLSDLHRRFGNWELAMAAYNMGHGGLSRAIRKFNSNDFWELSRHEAGIPWETTLYVPKIFAIAIVMSNRRAFGLDGITPSAAESFDTVRIAPGVLLSRVAAAAEVSVAVLEELNPQLLSARTPPSPSRASKVRWPVRVPAGTGTAASKRLARVTGPESGLSPYRVRFGDTMGAIAASRGTTERRLHQINGFKQSAKLRAGTVLLLPQRATSGGGSSQDDVVAVPDRRFKYSDRKRVFYRVRSDDTVAAVVAAFGVTHSEVIAWNALDDSARLQSGMVLQLYVKSDAALDRVRYLTERETRVLVVGTPEFFDYFEGLKGKQRILVKVQSGDTLRSIGRRYGMSVGWMERVNRRSRRDQLTPGETVVVYAPRSAASPGSVYSNGPAVSPLPPVDPPLPRALPATLGT